MSLQKNIAILMASLLLAACSSSNPQAVSTPPIGDPTLTATPRAKCGPGSRPETGLQGRVSKEDTDSGRAALGYTCNMEVVGSYAETNASDTFGGFKVERYTDAAGHDCAYYDLTLVLPTADVFYMKLGVNVLDMSDPTKSVLTANLQSPAMIAPHESLVLSKQRGLLVAVMGMTVEYPGVVDVYDIAADCRHPVLKASAPVGILGHESGMAPDGKTFYSAAPSTSSLTAIDISNPELPIPIAVSPIFSHGLSLSDDGNRAYVASVSVTGAADESTKKGLLILDTSEVQARKLNPSMPIIAHLTWEPISTPQNAIPFTIKGHPYLVEIDEFGAGKAVGAGRIIDIGDDTQPKIISNLRLEVHNPENFESIKDDPAAASGVQGYAAHYCNVPQRKDPTIVACSMILSGLRVFDIRDPYHPREVAYFNAPISPIPATVAPGNYAMSSPSFVPERKEIWYDDRNSGFYALRVTNAAWPD